MLKQQGNETVQQPDVYLLRVRMIDRQEKKKTTLLIIHILQTPNLKIRSIATTGGSTYVQVR